MTQDEFYNMTGVAVDGDEFWSIVSEYNRSSFTKVEFCQEWKKQNRDRVDAIRKAKEKRVKAWNDIVSLDAVLARLPKYWSDDRAVEFLLVRHKKTLEKLGIRLTIAGRDVKAYELKNEIEYRIKILSAEIAA